MAVIQEIRQYVNTGKNAHHILIKTGASSIEEVQRPLAVMSNESAVRLVTRWMSERKGKSAIVQLQLQNKQKSIMHYIGLRAYTQHLYFLHVWKPSICYDEKSGIAFFVFRLSEFFYPLLARRDIGAGVEQPFGHRPEPSGRVVRGGVDGLDSGG